jgi:hypothetical protein
MQREKMITLLTIRFSRILKFFNLNKKHTNIYTMSLFKPKNSKKIIVSDRATTTLDNKHKQILEMLNYDENIVLPQLEADKESIKTQLHTGGLSIDTRLELKDKLKQIREQINKIKKAKNEYFLDNSKYVFNYFETKKNIAHGRNKTTVLNNFFNIASDAQVAKKEEKNTVQQYLANVDESFVDMSNYITPIDVCQSCHKGELIPIEHQGIIICNSCSKTTPYLTENEKPSYKEPPKEVCCYAYKRINHFREILAQFQAKETTQIPIEVLENIKKQIKKERINLEQVTNKKAKDILKKLGYNKYYEHIPFIKDKLGIKPPVMSPELEERLCNLFIEIQAPYAKYCPEERVNFLNYYYTVYKLCELLNHHQFLPYFPMLKDREKRIEQDDIWKQICQELNWEFIPTI